MFKGQSPQLTPSRAGWSATIAAAVGLLCVPLALHAQNLTIGMADGREEFTFGSIDEVKVDPANRIFVLEGWGGGLRWYNSTGSYSGRVGRSGQGPGEFRSLTDFTFDAKGRIHVLDTGNGKVAIYELADGRAHHVVDQRTSIRGGVGICSIGDRRFVLSIWTPQMVNELDSAGVVQRSFGTPVEPDRTLAREFRGGPTGHILTHGKISCDQKSQRIVYHSARLGEIHLYDLSGRRVWQTQLRDFVRQLIKYSDAAKTCCQMGPDPETGLLSHVQAAFIAGNHVIVSVETSDRGGAKTYELRRLRVSDGVEVTRSPARMTVMQLLADGRQIGYRREPFPQVIVQQDR